MPVPLNDNNTADQYMYICGGLTVCRCVMCGSMVYILYTVLCSLFKVYTCHQIFSSDVLVPFSRLLLLPKHLNWMFLGKCEPFNKEHKGSAWPLMQASLIYHTFGTQSLNINSLSCSQYNIYKMLTSNYTSRYMLTSFTHCCRVFLSQEQAHFTQQSSIVYVCEIHEYQKPHDCQCYTASCSSVVM